MISWTFANIGTWLVIPGVLTPPLVISILFPSKVDTFMMVF